MIILLGKEGIRQTKTGHCGLFRMVIFDCPLRRPLMTSSRTSPPFFSRKRPLPHFSRGIIEKRELQSCSYMRITLSFLLSAVRINTVIYRKHIVLQLRAENSAPGIRELIWCPSTKSDQDIYMLQNSSRAIMSLSSDEFVCLLSLFGLSTAWTGHWMG